MSTLTLEKPKCGSRLEEVLARGNFAVIADLEPPRSADAEAVIAKARNMAAMVDAIVVKDNPGAVVSMSPIAAGLCALRAGIEPVIQVSCRDRNRIAIRSDLLGACALGLKNVVCLSGDHQSLGEHPSSKNVYDVDSIQLIGMLAEMRDGGAVRQLTSGAVRQPALGAAPGGARNPLSADMAAGLKLLIGGHENPCGDPLELRVIRLAKAAAAGADFILTTWIHDVERFMEYMRLIRDRGLHRQVKILAGIALPGLPGKTAGARGLRMGHSLSETYRARLENAKDRMAEGVNIYIEQIRLLREIEGVAGIYLTADEPPERIEEIMKGAGLLPRPESGRTP